MERIPAEECEWAVNALGAVLLAVPPLSPGPLQEVRVTPGGAVVLHGWFRRTEVPLPAAVRDALSRQDSLLLVEIGAGGNASEHDVPVRQWPPASGG